MFELPSELVLLISAGIGFLVTNGLKALFPAVDISGVSAKVTAAVVTAVITLVNWGLSFLPPEFREPVAAAFTLIVAILSAYGIHYSLKGGQPKG